MKSHEPIAPERSCRGMRHISELLPPIIEELAERMKQRELRAGRIALGLEPAGAAE